MGEHALGPPGLMAVRTGIAVESPTGLVTDSPVLKECAQEFIKKGFASLSITKKRLSSFGSPNNC